MDKPITISRQGRLRQHQGHLKHPFCKDGFTLLEAIIVIAILAIIAGIALPAIFTVLERQETDSTRSEMEQIQKAIIGDPGAGRFGYLGEMGRLPSGNSLADLNTKGSQRACFNGTLGVRMGWCGPYLNVGFSSTDYLTDAWGEPYLYDSTSGQITSKGPDRTTGGGDDIVYPPNPLATTGSFLINIMVWDAASGNFVMNPSAAAYPGMTLSGRVYFFDPGLSGGGNENSISFNIAVDGDPPYVISSNMHHGRHAIEATCDLDGAGPLPAARGSLVSQIVEGNQTIVTLTLK